MSVIPPDNPLSYVGKEPVARDYIRRTDPTPQDFSSFDIGDTWINIASGNAFKLVSKASGVATWSEITPAGAAGVITINTIAPDGAGDFTLTAGAGITVTPGVNQVTIAATASAVTLQGDVGGMQTDAAGNFRLLGTNTTGSGITINSGAASPIVEWAMASPYSQADFSFQSAAGGSLYTHRTAAFFNVAGSAARNFIEVGGAASDDPYTEYAVGGANNYATGIDNSDLDAYKLTTNTGPTDPSSGTELWKMTQTGARTMAQQPSFIASLSANALNVTGDGSVYTLVADNELADRGSDYDNATGIFTAPVTGLYFFTVTFECSQVAVTHTGCTIRLQTTPRRWLSNTHNPGAIIDGSGLTISNSWMIPLSATDTVTVELDITGGALVVDVQGDIGGPTTTQTYFAGHLIA